MCFGLDMFGILVFWLLIKGGGHVGLEDIEFVIDFELCLRRETSLQG